jgi:Flp pilus assembly protein TadD
MDKKYGKTATNENEETLMELAKFYFMNSRYDEAIDGFRKVLARNPGNAEAYYNLGLIYENKNDVDEARAMYEKALAIEDEYKLAREHLNRLIGLKNE